VSVQEEIAGSEVARLTGLASGTLYPILARLEQAGWLGSRWEAEDPSKLGRPRRRLYRVTAVGAKQARAALNEIRNAIGGLAWN
jgi:PadR family transcriptional regulator PadR